jgi:hypothetical protein
MEIEIGSVIFYLGYRDEAILGPMLNIISLLCEANPGWSRVLIAIAIPQTPRIAMLCARITQFFAPRIQFEFHVRLGTFINVLTQIGSNTMVYFSPEQSVSEEGQPIFYLGEDIIHAGNIDTIMTAMANAVTQLQANNISILFYFRNMGIQVQIPTNFYAILTQRDDPLLTNGLDYTTYQSLVYPIPHISEEIATYHRQSPNAAIIFQLVSNHASTMNRFVISRNSPVSRFNRVSYGVGYENPLFLLEQMPLLRYPPELGNGKGKRVFESEQVSKQRHGDDDPLGGKRRTKRRKRRTNSKSRIIRKNRRVYH